MFIRGYNPPLGRRNVGYSPHPFFSLSLSRFLSTPDHSFASSTVKIRRRRRKHRLALQERDRDTLANYILQPMFSQKVISNLVFITFARSIGISLSIVSRE